MVVFQSCRSEASVPSWMLLYEGPVMLLCEYPKRKLTVDCGSSMRSMSVMRRVVANKCGESSIGIDGVEPPRAGGGGGFRGFAHKSKSEKLWSRRKLLCRLYHLLLSARRRRALLGSPPHPKLLR